MIAGDAALYVDLAQSRSLSGRATRVLDEPASRTRLGLPLSEAQ